MKTLTPDKPFTCVYSFRDSDGNIQTFTQIDWARDKKFAEFRARNIHCPEGYTLRSVTECEVRECDRCGNATAGECVIGGLELCSDCIAGMDAAELQGFRY